MFVRELKRKTTRNIGVVIVESYRNKNGLPRQRTIRHMGSVPKGPALDQLLRVAQLELQRLRAAKIPALFPPETLAELALAARRRRQADRPLPIADARKLAEESAWSSAFTRSSASSIRTSASTGCGPRGRKSRNAPSGRRSSCASRIPAAPNAPLRHRRPEVRSRSPARADLTA